MSMISTVEDDIIAQIKNVLGNKLRAIESLPGVLNLDMLKKIAPLTPAVYITCLGGPKGDNSVDSAQIKAVFALYIITGQPTGNDARRRGDARQMGAYDIIDYLVPVVHGHTVTNVGTLKFQRLENLFTLDIDKAGVSIYAVTFELPMSLEYQVDLSTLDGFVTFDAVHSISADANVPTSEDTVTLAQ